MSDGYPRWLKARIEARTSVPAVAPSSVSFSILTCVYERTVGRYFEETWESLRQQQFKNFEWLVLAQGKLSGEVEALLQRLEKERKCRILRLPANLGIVPGLRYCLKRARADYIVPVDA